MPDLDTTLIEQSGARGEREGHSSLFPHKGNLGKNIVSRLCFNRTS